MASELEVELAELRALVGVELVPALRAATGRAIAGEPYDLTGALGEAWDRIAALDVELAAVRAAFAKVAAERNELRARIKRQNRT
jgi:hypothetical protein